MLQAGFDCRLFAHLLACLPGISCRFDRLAASLATPGVVALLTAWAPQLHQLYTDAVAAHAATSNTPSGAITSPGLQLQGLGLAAFLEVLQDKGVIPQLLEPSDVHEVLRQLLVVRADQVGVLWLPHVHSTIVTLSCG